MDKDNGILRVVVVEDSRNDAELLLNILRKAGYGMRPVLVEDAEELEAALQGPPFDLVLHKAALEQPSLAQTVRIVEASGQALPVIAIAEREGEPDVVSALRDGARDLVVRSQAEHLQRVVARELVHLRNQRALERCQKAYRESERRCRSLLDSSRDAIAYVHQGMHIYCNAAYLGLFRFQEIEEIEGIPFMDMVAAQDHAKLKDFLRRNGEDGHAQLEVRCRRANGEEFQALMQFTPASIEGEACTQIVIRDQSLTQELENKIKSLSRQDPSTGLYNRQYFLEELDLAVTEAQVGTGGGALLYIGLDGLDAVKERAGSAAYDRALIEFAALLKEQSGADEVAARIGEATFTVLARRRDSQAAQDLAGRIRQEAETRVHSIAGHPITLTTSIGIVLLERDAHSTELIMSQAELAHETARKGGGNRLQLHNPRADAAAVQERLRQWERQIRDVLARDRFRLVYQPIMSLRGEPGECYEVLLRMIDEKGEDVLPSQFLPSAEQSGLMGDIDRWVIRRAIARLVEQQRNGKDTCFFVKLSGQSLDDAELFSWIRTHLSQTRLPPSSLVFEVAEPVALAHLSAAKAFLQGLRGLGCNVALDRFGKGSNSFQLLEQLPADYLKLDGSLMQQLAKAPEKQAKVKALVQAAHAQGKFTIAGFVEDAASLSVLWQCGVDYIQGNFLQAPYETLEFDFEGETV